MHNQQTYANDYKQIKFSGFSILSFWKLTAIGFVTFFAPFITLIGTLSVFNFHTISVNEMPVNGPIAFVIAPLFGIIFSICMTFAFGLSCTIGLWIFSKFRPLSLEVKGLRNEQ